MAPESSWNPNTSRTHACEWWWDRYSRDEYTCPDCGRGTERVNGFDVHHKDGNPRNNSPENLVALCKRCHAWRHHGRSLSGLDVGEWKAEFLGDEESIKHNTVYSNTDINR